MICIETTLRLHHGTAAILLAALLLALPALAQQPGKPPEGFEDLKTGVSDDLAKPPPGFEYVPLNENPFPPLTQPPGCGFSKFGSWKYEQERLQKELTRSKAEVDKQAEELRWVAHDIRQRQFLPSHTVRAALDKYKVLKPKWDASVVREQELKLCLEYAREQAK